MSNTTPDQLTAMLAKMTPGRIDQFWTENPHLLHLRPDGPQLPRKCDPAAQGIPGPQRLLEPAKSQGMTPSAPAKKRLRQSTKPLLNKLETAFFDWMKANQPEMTLRPQAKRYELARGLWYKPDFTTVHDGQEIAYECKGPKAFRGGFENLKMAARVWPEVTFILVWKWKDSGEWKFQVVIS